MEGYKILVVLYNAAVVLVCFGLYLLYNILISVRAFWISIATIVGIFDALFILVGVSYIDYLYFAGKHQELKGLILKKKARRK